MTKTRHPRDIRPERQFRVRVRIGEANGKYYPEGTVEALDGSFGVPVRYNPKSFRGRPAPGPAYLVRLEKPAVAWWSDSDQEVVEEFWIAKQDLRRV